MRDKATAAPPLPPERVRATLPSRAPLLPILLGRMRGSGAHLETLGCRSEVSGHETRQSCPQVPIRTLPQTLPEGDIPHAQIPKVQGG